MASRFMTPFSGSLGLRGGDPLLDLHREMNRLFEDVFTGGGLPTMGAQQGSLMSMPRLDMREDDNELCISAELPGVKESDIELRIEGDTLVLSGEKKSEIDEKKENVHLMERSYGRFRRTLPLPFAPKPEEVKADFQHGVLTIHIPRAAQQQLSRRIEIHGGTETPSLGQGGTQAASGQTMTGGGGMQQQGAGGTTGSQPGTPGGMSTH